MRVFPLNEHFHSAKCRSLQSTPAGKISVTKNSGSPGRQSGLSDSRELLLKIQSRRDLNWLNEQTGRIYAATQTRSHVLSVTQIGHAGSSRKTCVCRRAESARQQTERCAAGR